ncbi:MAG: hypothetical protein R2734_13625 [Nocardioides sp.]
MNEVWPVPDGVKIARFAPIAHEEPCLDAGHLEAVIDEVMRLFDERSDEAVADVVRATDAWKEASQGGWCLAPEVIRDEFVGPIHPWAGLT